MSLPLIVALHGVGSSAEELAAALSPLHAVADVVALDGADPFDGGGSGRQWFSIRGVTEQNRPERVLGALPPLLERLDRLAGEYGLARKDLVPLGFSQGAIMTLALIAQGLHSGHAIAVAGRLAAPVLPAVTGAGTLLLVHDQSDPVMATSLSDDAAVKLSAAGHHVDVARTEGVGHRVGSGTINEIARWLHATSSSEPLLDSKGYGVPR